MFRLLAMLQTELWNERYAKHNTIKGRHHYHREKNTHIDYGEQFRNYLLFRFQQIV